MDFTTVGENIRKKRIEKNLTQDQLSEKADITPAYIGMIERGEKLPRLETFVRIANSLDISTDELLGYELVKSDSAKLSKYEIEINKLSNIEKQRLFSIIEAFLGL